MKEIYKYLALTNEKGEPSGHKLTSFAYTVFIAYIHYKYLTTDTAYSFLIVDSICVMLLLGRVTFSQILKFKNGDKESL